MDFNTSENELEFELCELYPGLEDDSEDDVERDLQEVDEIVEDDKSFVDEDYDLIVEGVRPTVLCDDPNLVQLKSEYGDGVFYNSPDDNEVIAGCEDKCLQLLLIKNRIRAKQLQLLRSKLTKILKESVETVFNSESSKGRSPVGLSKTDVWKLGTPYFKDRQFYPSPPNSDFIRKKENKELMLISLKSGRRWQPEHQDLLQNTVERMYYEDYVEKLQYRLTILKAKCKKDHGNVQWINELEDVKNEVRKVEEMNVSYKVPPLMCDSINWQQVAEVFKGSRSANECKGLWNVYLHPQINKKLWTAKENAQIKQLAKKYRRQNWDRIALELGTNRSGYLVHLQYCTNLCSKFKTVGFTEKEDEKIVKLVDKYRVGNFIPWRAISTHFRDRSKSQIYHRYKYYLADVRTKGPFSEAEDVFILYLISKYGMDFRKCAEFLPHRSCIQIRNHYRGSLCGDVKTKRGSYSLDDDLAIMEHVKKNGPNNWIVLTKGMGRNSSHVRQRYYSLRKWLSNSGCTLENIPRRQHDMLHRNNFQRDYRVRKVSEQLHEYPTEVNLAVIQELLSQSIAQAPRVNTKRKCSYYDKKIIDFLKGTCKIQREYKKYTPYEECAGRILKLLPLLWAHSSILENADRAVVSDQVGDILANINEQTPTTSQSLLQLVMPPTLNTILGLRGLILKYQLYKESATTRPSRVPIKPLCESEHALFSKRFYALFKWPCVISNFFPEKLLPEEPTAPPEKSAPTRASEAKAPKRKSEAMAAQRKKKRATKAVSLSYKRMKLDGQGTSEEIETCDTERDDSEDANVCDSTAEVILSYSVDSNLPLVDSNTVMRLGMRNKNIKILSKNDVIKVKQVGVITVVNNDDSND